MIYGRLTLQTLTSMSQVALHNLKIIKYKQIVFKYAEMQTPPFFLNSLHIILSAKRNNEIIEDGYCLRKKKFS